MSSGAYGTDRHDSLRNKTIVWNGESFAGCALRPFLIYAAINQVNGKAYVGYTSQSLKIRSQNHFRHAKAGSTFIFHRAIRKYGPDAFRFYIIEHLSDHAAALRAEVHDIETLSPEYNMTFGGEGGCGRRNSAETIAKMSAAARSRAKKPPTELQRAATITMQKKSQDALRRRVMYEKTGCVYPSVTVAARAFGLCTNQVSNSCKGVRHARGHKFKYIDN